ncbi:MAG: hypothetical protein A2017_05580 [Lentisphaerae bacterium GWF2_44_16]|nr:MAG: hypothetical protein A2017_05580 [Lentisphaerae bacterium GWF2_44_16]
MVILPHRRAHFRDSFSPDDLAGLIEWLDADTISGNDGDAVATWTARTGANAVQATEANKPLLKKGANGINGHNVIRPDGSNDYMSISINLRGYTQWTWFMVFQNSADAGVIADYKYGGGAWAIRRKTASFYDGGTRGGTWAYDTNPHVYSGSAKNSGTYNHFIDGVDKGNGAFGTASFIESGDTIILGANRTPDGDWYAGKIRAFLIYNVQHSTENRQLVENYLMNDAGI